jgi:fructose-bisphosphate aldolase class II
MPIVTNKELLVKAKAGHYAVPAFNTNNLEYIQAILQAASELHSPVILEAAKSEVDYMGGRTFVEIVRSIVADLSIPVGIHLDHGPSYDEAIRAIHYGFKSVMYDGSLLPLDENIANTKAVVKAAHACGVTVEGEIGVIGQAANSPEGAKNDMIGIADPAQCERFVKETGIDCLAAGIGNAHGIYKKKPELHFDVLAEIEKRVGGIPLVLHGGTGIPEEDLRKAITMGVSKINFGTVMRKAFIEQLAIDIKGPMDWELMALLTPAKNKMIETAKNHIRMVMSDSKA